MSLMRLWLIPAGAEATAGAYLRYPSADLLRLIALESWRHRAIVIGEDLGTVPPECRKQLARAGLLGLDVLPFMRDGEDFLPPARWRSRAAAMTSTHDLPPVAGWWRARDLDWRNRLGLFGAADERSERRERKRQRAQLGRRLHPKAAREDLAVPLALRVDAAIDYVASAPTPLALIPLEDLLGADEAPNLPGTIDVHPNWQRRYPATADGLFARTAVRRRLERLGAKRRKRR
jgi:4-alpha-glucanotransferase